MKRGDELSILLKGLINATHQSEIRWTEVPKTEFWSKVSSVAL